MQMPTPVSLVFLAYVLGLLPWAGFRTFRRIRATRAGGAAARLPSREAIWTGTLVNQGVLFVLAWYAARGFDDRLFAVPALGLREIAAALGALAICFVLRSIARATRSEEERRKMMVYRIVPRTGREWESPRETPER